MNGCVKIGSTDMYYAAFGKGEKKLVVLPGLVDGLATVKGKSLMLQGPYKKHLKDYTVYMFSRKNEMPDGYSIKDMAEDQVVVMKTLGIDKASILGVSQGGMIAQCIAIYHPEVTDRLILAVTAPYCNDIARDAVGTWIEMAKRDDYAALFADTAEKTYSEKYLAKNRKTFPLVAKLTKPASFERFFRNAYAIMDFDVRSELHRIKAPMLILAGDNDHIVGNDAPYELNRGIEGSKLYIYNGLGHSAYEEGKDFYDRVFEFIDEGE